MAAAGGGVDDADASIWAGGHRHRKPRTNIFAWEFQCGLVLKQYGGVCAHDPGRQQEKAKTGRADRSLEAGRPESHVRLAAKKHAELA